MQPFTMNNLIWINYKYYLFTLVFLNNFPYWFIRIEKASTSISNFPRGKLFRSSGEIKIHLSKWRAGFEFEDSSFIKATPWMPNEQDKMMGGVWQKSMCVCVEIIYWLSYAIWQAGEQTDKQMLNYAPLTTAIFWFSGFLACWLLPTSDIT